ncbi:MAG: sulfatase [Acidobacteria bacterium]|nr:sulfatase [Acidobacteriota bacterium]
MDRRGFLQTSIGAALAAPFARGQARKPNVVVLFADDLGYGDLGSYGGKDIPTPNIDSIARNGVRFTNGYVSCPVCSPTRAGLMTGRYQQRFGHEFNPGPAQQAQGDFSLPLSETTIADRMKAAGYATGIVGKWHLGYKPEYHPMKRGFDEFFGFLGGAHSYLDAKADQANPILRGTKAVNETEYLTDAFTREAVAFIERHKQSPFFLYLPYNAVHNPAQATEKYLSRFGQIKDEKRRIHAAKLSSMDDGIGSVLGKVRELGLEENTLIFFISDNGGPTRQTTSKNDPLSGFKGDVLEGGIRVPFLLQWKSKLRGGARFDQPVIALDVLPTAVAVAGGSAGSNLDGVDLMPHLTGATRKSPHDLLYWRFGAQSAVRKGDWKLVKIGDAAPRLYNLARDVNESKDVAASEPGKVKELQAAFDAWNRQLMEPRWKNQCRTGAQPGSRSEEGNRPRKGRRRRD